jgi:non-heme Fe2+,alpha-ketoglutarate-dependent halogenase
MSSRNARPVEAGEIAKRYARDGFFFPLDVLSRAQAADYRREFEDLERRVASSDLGNKRQLNHTHVIFRFAHRIATHPRILDAVEAILGPDILIWGSTFFIKAARSESYVSWHQDLRYWGLDGDAEVSAWVALSPADKVSGCMRFVPGSHSRDMLPHRDTFADDNLLTRGQEATVDIAEEETVLVPLEPGQASLHHGKLLHSSGPNRSDDRRIGFAINYVSPDMRQVVAKDDFAMLARGEDRYGHFSLVPPPDDDLSEAALAWHLRVHTAQNQALYQGVGAGKA